MTLILLSVFFSNLVWGLAPLLAKCGLQHVSEVSFLFFRFGLSTLLFAPIIFKSAGKLRRLPRRWLLAGIVVISAHYYLQVVALRGAPVTWYVFFYALCPILNLLVLRESLSKRHLLVGALALAGTGLFIDLVTAPQISLLTLLALGSSLVTWILFTIIVREWQVIFTDSEISGLTSALSFAVFGGFTLLNSGSTLRGWTLPTAGATLLLAVLLPLAFLCYSYSLRKRSDLAILGQYAEPLFGTLAAVFFLGETLSVRQIGGLVLTVTALTVLVLTKQKIVNCESFSQG